MASTHIKTLVVIVTHNRLALLERCINAVKNQSKKLDEILIVNNGSTDGTKNFLDSLSVKSIHQENVGSAGGWHAGLDYALKNRFDFCWLMDDDGFPAENSNELLSKNFPKGYSCLSSIVVCENQINKLVFPMPILNSNGHPKISLFKPKINFLDNNSCFSEIYPFAHLFNGAMISMDAVKKIGNIDKNYFIMGDEVDYFYRLREYGPIGTLSKSLHIHPDVSKRSYSKIKIYYLLKNTIINHKKYMNFSSLRNIGLIFIVMLRLIQRNGIIFFLLLLLDKEFIIFKAIFRGYKLDLRKDF
ncbi:glycosyltransferase [Gammaproteobacteria bacterium]|nr:glycosyltransferase [Gammaproteobacteria bacterium]